MTPFWFSELPFLHLISMPGFVIANKAMCPSLRPAQGECCTATRHKRVLQREQVLISLLSVLFRFGFFFPTHTYATWRPSLIFVNCRPIITLLARTLQMGT